MDLSNINSLAELIQGGISSALLIALLFGYVIWQIVSIKKRNDNIDKDFMQMKNELDNLKDKVEDNKNYFSEMIAEIKADIRTNNDELKANLRSTNDDLKEYIKALIEKRD